MGFQIYLILKEESLHLFYSRRHAEHSFVVIRAIPSLQRNEVTCINAVFLALSIAIHLSFKVLHGLIQEKSQTIHNYLYFKFFTTTSALYKQFGVTEFLKRADA